MLYLNYQSLVWCTCSMLCLSYTRIDPNKSNGFSHSYQMGESTFILGASRVVYFFFIYRENSCHSFCGVTSGTIRFAYVHKKGTRLI